MMLVDISTLTLLTGVRLTSESKSTFYILNRLYFSLVIPLENSYYGLWTHITDFCY